MRAAVFTRFGPPEVVRVEEVARPVPREGELVVRIRAATLSTADGEVRSFSFPLWLRLPLRLMFGVFRPRARVRILGQELAGEIEALGPGVEGHAVGDRVVVALDGFGGHAEAIRLPASAVIARLPSNASFEEGACLTVFALTALHAVRRAELGPGSRLLINGAGGSIGTIAVQLAREAGAEVTAVDGPRQLELLRSLGVRRIVDYTERDFTTLGETWDAIIDVHGGSPYGRSIRCLARDGRYVLANPKLSSLLLGLWTSATSGRSVRIGFSGYRREDLEHLVGLVEAGRLRPAIDRRFPLESIVEAYRYVEAGSKRGNVVLTTG